MRLPPPQLPTTGAAGPVADLTKALTDYLRLVQQQVNANGDGTIAGATSANSAPPPPTSTTLYAAGDFIRNNAPLEQGSSGAKYIVIGWVCTVGGTPGTWLACRSLTGD
jgi:hypothetical protein